jgi:hypothetical protein
MLLALAWCWCARIAAEMPLSASFLHWKPRFHPSLLLLHNVRRWCRPCRVTGKALSDVGFAQITCATPCGTNFSATRLQLRVVGANTPRPFRHPELFNDAVVGDPLSDGVIRSRHSALMQRLPCQSTRRRTRARVVVFVSSPNHARKRCGPSPNLTPEAGGARRRTFPRSSWPSRRKQPALDFVCFRLLSCLA